MTQQRNIIAPTLVNIGSGSSAMPETLMERYTQKNSPVRQSVIKVRKTDTRLEET